MRQLSHYRDLNASAHSNSDRFVLHDPQPCCSRVMDHCCRFYASSLAGTGRKPKPDNRRGAARPNQAVGSSETNEGFSRVVCTPRVFSLPRCFPRRRFLRWPHRAETIFGALTKAYQLNSELNSARAGVRVTDEGVPIAKSGYRPTIGGQRSIDYSSNETVAGSRRLTTGSFGVEINQMLFDGFQTKNNVARRRSAGARLLRKPAQHRAEHPVQRGQRLYGRDPRPAGRGADRSRIWSS